MIRVEHYAIWNYANWSAWSVSYPTSVKRYTVCSFGLRPQAPDGLIADKKGELVGDVLNTALSPLDWVCFQMGSSASLFVFIPCESQNHNAVSTNRNLWRKKRTAVDSNPHPSAHQLRDTMGPRVTMICSRRLWRQPEGSQRLLSTRGPRGPQWRQPGDQWCN